MVSCTGLAWPASYAHSRNQSCRYDRGPPGNRNGSDVLPPKTTRESVGTTAIYPYDVQTFFFIEGFSIGVAYCVRNIDAIGGWRLYESNMRRNWGVWGETVRKNRILGNMYVAIHSAKLSMYKHFFDKTDLHCEHTTVRWLTCLLADGYGTFL